MSSSVALLIFPLLFAPVVFAGDDSPGQQKTTAWWCIVMRCPLIVPVMPPWNIGPQPTMWYQPPVPPTMWYQPPVPPIMWYQPPVPPYVEPISLPPIQPPPPPLPLEPRQLPRPHRSHHHARSRHRSPPPPPPPPPELHHRSRNRHHHRRRQHPPPFPRLRAATPNPPGSTSTCCQPSPPPPTPINPAPPLPRLRAATRYHRRGTGSTCCRPSPSPPPTSLNLAPPPPPTGLNPAPPPSQFPETPPPVSDECSAALVQVDGCVREVTEWFRGTEIQIGRECCAVISTLSDECFYKAALTEFNYAVVHRSKAAASAFCSAVHGTDP